MFTINVNIEASISIHCDAASLDALADRVADLEVEVGSALERATDQLRGATAGLDAAVKERQT